MSFIDSYVNAAKYRDEKTRNAKKEYIEGMGDLVKGGAEAYKFTKRKEALDKMAALDDEEKRLMAELRQLQGDSDYVGSRSNMDAILNGLDWNLMPKMYKG